MRDLIRHVRPAIESEKAVLGGLLLDPSLCGQITKQLCPLDFDLSFHQEIFESIRELLTKHNRFDIPMIIDDLSISGDHQKYLYELANECASTKNIKAHADIVREKSVQRQLLKVAHEIAEEAKNPGTSKVKDILDKAESSVMKLANAYDVCPFQVNLTSFLREFAEEVASSELTESYLRECIVEVNKALVATLEHVEENAHKE